MSAWVKDAERPVNGEERVAQCGGHPTALVR